MIRTVICLTGLFLGGCAIQAADEPHLSSAADIGILWSTQRFAVASDRPADLSDLVEQLRRFADGELDSLQVIIRGPGDQQALRDALAQAGVSASRIIVKPGDGDPLVSVVAERARAEARACPQVEVVSHAFGDNGRRPGLGCVDVGNLAGQAANPLDIIGNPAVPTPDGERAVTPVARYRAFSEPGAAAAK